MSNLNSLFDILRGWPDSSALEASFDPDTGVTLPEGTLCYVTSRELLPAKVLHMVDSTLVAAPALLAADRGKSYVVAGVGGAWSVFAIGDIVEWDGAKWNLIVSHLGTGNKWVPDGTRVVVIDVAHGTPAGAFAGDANKVMNYHWTCTATIDSEAGGTPIVDPIIGEVVTDDPDLGGAPYVVGTIISFTPTTGPWLIKLATPDTPLPLDDDVLSTPSGGAAAMVGAAVDHKSWVVANTPVNGNRVHIDAGTDSIYSGRYYDYSSALTLWGKSAHQVEAPAMLKKLTSGVMASAVKDHAWVVIQGNDQYDGIFVNHLACIKCMSGAVLKLPNLLGTLLAGDLVCANGGALKKLTVGGGMQWPIGQVLAVGGTGASAWVIIATY